MERITKQLEKIAEEICDNYCKFPQEYNSRTDDPDKNWELLSKEKCENCPLNKMV